MEPDFPLEFIVHGTPVSLQRRNPRARAEWQNLVRQASLAVLPEGHWTTKRLLATTLYYFPEDQMVGDIDNIVKLTLDALGQHIYDDDEQIERVLVQKFEQGRAFIFSDPSETLLECLAGQRPALYIRIQDDHEKEPVR